jgi:SAM-dependent methyltransferase
MVDASPLTPEQEATLARLLRNESDVAYRRRVRTMLRYLAPEPGQVILDCGTGMGFYARTINRLYPACRVVGVDGDARALAYAREHTGAQTALAQADIQRLPFAEASFDAVIMSEVLEHLEDDLGGLREVHRALKPGGILAVTVPYARYPCWYDPINRVAEGVFGSPIRQGPFAGIWANHRRLYGVEALRGVLVEAGFAPGPIEPMTHYCFPGTQTIVYTLGKGLVERNLLPAGVLRATHRFSGEENPGSRWNPLNWALALFHAVDRLNEDPRRLAGKQTFVNLAVRAIRL